MPPPECVPCPTPVQPPSAIPSPVPDSFAGASGLNGPVVAPQPRTVGRASTKEDVAVQLNPHRVVAPIGRPVVLLAGVRGGDGYLRTNRRLDWSILSGSVGQFVAIGECDFADLLVGDFTHPRIVSPVYAVGSTSRRNERVAQGPSPADSVYAVRGQGWITVMSACEGTSQVVVGAPDVVIPAARTQCATIHWIDASFGFPPPSIDPAGTRHILTTSVLRQSNQCPRPGWIVRYEVVGGPPAGFLPVGGGATGPAPTDAASIEVPSDAAGQASAQIFQKEAIPGTTQIRIQVFMPGAPGQRLLVGSGCAIKTWSAAALAVRMSAPAVVAVGAPLTYRIDVHNQGDVPAKEVVATDELPEGLTLVAARPAPVGGGKRLQWNLGDLGAGQRQVIEIDCRAMQQGSAANCVEVAAAGGARASQCASTTVFSPTLDVSITGPHEAKVGDEITFSILVTNRSQGPANDLLLTDRFGEGLAHATLKTPIEFKLGNIEPGKAKKLDVVFRVTRPGQLCHTAEVTGAGGLRASAQGCVSAVDVAAPAPVIGPQPIVQPPPKLAPTPAVAEPGQLSVQVGGPREATIGDRVTFTVSVTNTGSRAVTKVRIANDLDPAFLPENATDGYEWASNRKTLVWSRPGLQPGERFGIVLVCRCNQAASHACNRVTATADGGQSAAGEACLDIRAPAAPWRPAEKPETAPSLLSVSVTELNNPVKAGTTVQYLIVVGNQGKLPENNVVLRALIPPGSFLDRFATHDALGQKYEVPDDKAVLFRPIPELLSGQKLQYRVGITARQAGFMQMRAEVTSQRQLQPVVGTKTTEVLPAQN